MCRKNLQISNRRVLVLFEDVLHDGILQHDVVNKKVGLEKEENENGFIRGFFLAYFCFIRYKMIRNS